jgi:serine/threonine protein kinase
MIPPPIILKAYVRQEVVQGYGQRMNHKSQVLHSYSKVHYELGRIVKKTIYGAVVHAVIVQPASESDTSKFVRTGKEVAIKIFSKPLILQHLTNSKEKPLTEIAMLQYLGDGHENVLGQLECCADDQHIYSVMRWIPDGELFDYIAMHGRMHESEARDVFKGLLSALKRLQDKSIGHRDISLENILYNPETHQAILIDFGMSIYLPARQGTNGQRGVFDTKNDHCGKIHYMPPEVCRSDERIDPIAGDIWSAAVCLLYCLLGFPPMESALPEDPRYEMIISGKLRVLTEHWEINDLSSEVIDLLEMMLISEPEDRPSLTKILSHPWFYMRLPHTGTEDSGDQSVTDEMQSSNENTQQQELLFEVAAHDGKRLLRQLSQREGDDMRSRTQASC